MLYIQQHRLSGPLWWNWKRPGMSSAARPQIKPGNSASMSISSGSSLPLMNRPRKSRHRPSRCRKTRRRRSRPRFPRRRKRQRKEIKTQEIRKNKVTIHKVRNLFLSRQPLPSSSQAPHPSLCRKRQSSLVALFLLSPRKPLRWVFAGTPWLYLQRHHRPKRKGRNGGSVKA